MAVVINDFEVIAEPEPAPGATAQPQNAEPQADIDPSRLAEALARRQWSQQRVHAD